MQGNLPSGIGDDIINTGDQHQVVVSTKQNANTSCVETNQKSLSVVHLVIKTRKNDQNCQQNEINSHEDRQEIYMQNSKIKITKKDHKFQDITKLSQEKQEQRQSSTGLTEKQQAAKTEQQQIVMKQDAISEEAQHKQLQDNNKEADDQSNYSQHQSDKAGIQDSQQISKKLYLHSLQLEKRERLTKGKCRIRDANGTDIGQRFRQQNEQISSEIEISSIENLILSIKNDKALYLNVFCQDYSLDGLSSLIESEHNVDIQQNPIQLANKFMKLNESFSDQNIQQFKQTSIADHSFGMDKLVSNLKDLNLSQIMFDQKNTSFANQGWQNLKQNKRNSSRTNIGFNYQCISNIPILPQQQVVFQAHSKKDIDDIEWVHDQQTFEEQLNETLNLLNNLLGNVNDDDDESIDQSQNSFIVSSACDNSQIHFDGLFIVQEEDMLNIANQSSYHELVHNENPINGLQNQHQINNSLNNQSIANANTQTMIYNINTKIGQDLELDDNIQRQNCSICLDQIQPSQVVQETTCKHIYHKDCMEKHIEYREGDKGGVKCPNCRNEISNISLCQKSGKKFYLDKLSTSCIVLQNKKEEIPNNNKNILGAINEHSQQIVQEPSSQQQTSTYTIQQSLMEQIVDNSLQESDQDEEKV